MQLEISKASLVKSLSNINGAVEKRNTIPILLNVKIEAKNGELNLTATDMDIVVTSTIAASIKSEGKTTVPAQLFYDIVRKIPDNTNINIEFKEGESLIKIKYGRSNFSLPCLDAAEFPTLAEGEMLVEFPIKSAELARIIDRTRFAISSDETRYYLNGMFLHGLQNDNSFEIRGVATDGHRLALSFLKLENPGVALPPAIIPKKTINEIRRIIESSEEVKISLSKAKIKVAGGGCVIISKLIDGDFPEYDKVLPKNNDHIVKVNRKKLFDAIDRVATITTDKHRGIKFILERDKISLQVNAADGGFAEEEIEATYEGGRIETAFNSRYLLEMLSQIEKDEVNFRFKDGNSPTLLDAEQGDSLYVIMPIRV